jgi:hypothetical protein
MHGEEAMGILREFVADVLAAHGNDYNEARDTLNRDWFDLSITFQSAFALVKRAD